MGRFLGAEVASGEILLWVDADDTLRFDALEKLDAAFSTNDVDMVVYDAAHDPGYSQRRVDDKSLLKYRGGVIPLPSLIHSTMTGSSGLSGHVYHLLLGGTYGEAIDSCRAFREQPMVVELLNKLPVYLSRVRSDWRPVFLLFQKRDYRALSVYCRMRGFGVFAKKKILSLMGRPSE